MFYIKYIILMLYFCNQYLTDAARILAISPYPSHSHQVVFNALFSALHERGHELIVFTTDPMNRNLTNYTEVSLNALYNDHTNKFNMFEISSGGVFKLYSIVYEFGGKITDYTYSHRKLKEIIAQKDKNKIDLILVSSILWDSLYYLSDLLDAPMIGMSSLPTLVFHNYIMGNPFVSACYPDSMSEFTDKMNFKERLLNYYQTVRQVIEYNYLNLPVQDRVLRKHFGDTAPPIEELSSRLSMIFTNAQPFFSYPRPLVPGIFEFGGFRYKNLNKTVPKDLKKILDNAKNGFIYFSLGTNVKSVSLGDIIINKFIQVFAELPYDIIWKFEAENLPNKPNNVYIQKWMPQNGILAHRNIKLFLYQGGLQSTEEAIENGVPLLACPVFSDQMYNVKNLVTKGLTKSIDLRADSKDCIRDTIHEIIDNSTYRENIIKLRELLNDRPMDRMNETIWWVEHIIRHKGGKHLRTRSRDMQWYQVELVDIFAFLLTMLIIISFITWKILQFTIVLIKNNIIPCIKNFKTPKFTSMTEKKLKSS